MAPRRVLLLLAAVAAACSFLASSPAAVVHAARDLPSVPAAETSGAVRPPTAADGVPNNVLPHMIHPAVLADATDPDIQRTVYDVTVVFRATARLGPPRLQYYVVPADADAPVSGGADDVEFFVAALLLFFLGIFLGAFAVHVHHTRRLESSGDDGAVLKNPEAVPAPTGAAKARGSN